MEEISIDIANSYGEEIVTRFEQILGDRIRP